MYRNKVAFFPLRDNMSLFGIKDFDSVIIHRAEKILKVLIRVDIIVESFIYFFEREIALLPPFGYKLINFFFRVLIFWRQF